MSGTQENQSQAPKQGFFARMGRQLRDTRGEMKKVVWPSKKQAINNTGVVLVFMAFMAVVIGLFDGALAALLNLFFGSGV